MIRHAYMPFQGSLWVVNMACTLAREGKAPEVTPLTKGGCLRVYLTVLSGRPKQKFQKFGKLGIWESGNPGIRVSGYLGNLGILEFGIC